MRDRTTHAERTAQQIVRILSPGERDEIMDQIFEGCFDWLWLHERFGLRPTAELRQAVRKALEIAEATS